MVRLLRLSLALGAAALLSACASTFQTSYPARVDPAVSRDWRLQSVEVTVPTSLTVSTDPNVLISRANIVWYGDLAGDRRKQVGEVLKQGIVNGASGLHGHRKITIRATLEEFNALTPAAQRLEMDNVGVNNVRYTFEVVDSRTGKVLFGPQDVQDAVPAMTGENEAVASAQGVTQKVAITRHIAQTVAGMLGAGPDNRASFTRIGY